MKVVLINPAEIYPKKYFSLPDIRLHYPLGLLYAASMARQKYETSVIDSFSCQEELFSEDETNFYMGAQNDVILRRVKSENPDVVGITSPFTSQFSAAAKLVGDIKKEFPHVKIVGGGPHGAVRPNDFLKSGVDYLVQGEGEYTFMELLDALEKEKPLDPILGLAYRDGEAMKINPRRPYSIKDIDAIPPPAYDMVNLENYFTWFKKGHTPRKYIPTERLMTVITSRGCPFRCVFCSIHLSMGRIWRGHSIPYLREHFNILTQKYGVEHFSFEDDNIACNRKRFDQILDMMQQEKYDITWDTPNGVRADTMSRDTLVKAKKTGCIRLVIATESGDQEVLDKVVKKDLKLTQVVEVAKICKEIDLDLHSFFIVGFPDETKQNIKNTFNFALMLNRKYNTVPAFSIANPLLGTDLYKQCVERGLIEENISPEQLMVGAPVQTGGMITTENFDPAFIRSEVKMFYRKLMLQQVLKPRYVIKKFLTEPGVYLAKAKRLLAFSSKAQTTVK